MPSRPPQWRRSSHTYTQYGYELLFFKARLSSAQLDSTRLTTLFVNVHHSLGVFTLALLLLLLFFLSSASTSSNFSGVAFTKYGLKSLTSLSTARAWINLELWRYSRTARVVGGISCPVREHLDAKGVKSKR